MNKEKFLAILLAVQLRNSGITYDISEIDSVTFNELLESLNLDEVYNVDDIKSNYREINSNNTKVKDYEGLSPLYNLIDKYRIDIAEVICKEINDTDCNHLISEYRRLETEINEIKTKLTNILEEPKYMYPIEKFINHSKSLSEILIRYITRMK